jgi:hypothetical protein
MLNRLWSKITRWLRRPIRKMRALPPTHVAKITVQGQFILPLGVINSVQVGDTTTFWISFREGCPRFALYRETLNGARIKVTAYAV